MANLDCTSFLQAVLPRLGLRWRGFRNVRGQVCKRLANRTRELGLTGLHDYHAYLASHADEWTVLDGLCRVAISRFYRDRAVFACLRDEILPALARGARAQGLGQVPCASLGCASGEEAYSLRVVWLSWVATVFPQLELTVLGVDADPVVLRRAERGQYAPGSFREMPAELVDRWCERREEGIRVGDELRRHVRFQEADIRAWSLETQQALVLCRNLAFTYFDEPEQARVADRLAEATAEGGYLVVGGHEALPSRCAGWGRVHDGLPVYRRVGVK